MSTWNPAPARIPGPTLLAGTQVRLIDPNYRTEHVGILEHDARANVYGTYTIREGNGRYRSEGILKIAERLYIDPVREEASR